MRVLVIYNDYLIAGGERNIYLAEANLLETHQNTVIRYERDNRGIEDKNRLGLAARTIWNPTAYRELKALIRREHPDIAHVHNTFPQISPAAYYAVHDAGLPVVQTLHNYRLLCPSNFFFRDGHVCEDCVGHFFPWPSVLHACYHDSRAITGVAAASLATHRLLRTWTRKIDLFIAYSHFTLNKFVETGIPRERLKFKTNFLYPVPEVGAGAGDYVLFVGFLSAHKGIKTLLEASRILGNKVKIKVAGDGPLRPLVSEAAQRMPWIEPLGPRPLEEVYQLMGNARALIFPSVWYETFGRVVIEAFATGTPVIASDFGAFAEMIDPQRTGLLFPPGDPQGLAAQIEWLLEHPTQVQGMRREARQEFEAYYTAEKNYPVLMSIYQEALG